MLKTWESQGIHLWTMQEGVLFLQVGEYEYPFSTAHIANTYYETISQSLSGAGEDTFSVPSTIGMTVNDPIGIIDENNGLQWSTIASFVANTSVTINDPLIVASNQNAPIYYYPANSFKPCIRVLNVRRKEGSDYEVPINFVSRETYFSLPNKNSQGYPVQAYFSRDIPEGTMYVWNAPSSAVPVIRFTYERKLQVMTLAEQTFDVPEYWYEAIIYNLAARLMPVYGCAPSRVPMIAGLARQSLSEALGFDTDIYPITIQMGQAQ